MAIQDIGVNMAEEAKPERKTGKPAEKAIAPNGQQAETARGEIEHSTAENFIAEKNIGARIRRLRLKKSMGLVELGRHTGLSASFLSQLETGRVVPTLRNLARIAMVFSKDLSYFFEAEPQSLFRVHRKAERVRLPEFKADEPAFYFESLGFQVPERDMDPYWATFQPTKQTLKSHAHPGYEFIYVIKGKLRIQHGENVAELGEGDALYFDSTQPHTYCCISTEAAMALIVTCPPMLKKPPAPAGDGASASPRKLK